MKRAILLTGFNNWGKTTHIYNMFGQKRFNYGSTYKILGVNASFTVESHSNDDYGEGGFLKTVGKRLAKSPEKGSKDLFCAFCPTRERLNDSIRILDAKPFSNFDEVHLLLLQYKWDFHAELRVKEIQSYLSPSAVPKARFFIVNSDANYTDDSQRMKAREIQIISYLQGVYS